MNIKKCVVPVHRIKAVLQITLNCNLFFDIPIEIFGGIISLQVVVQSTKYYPTTVSYQFSIQYLRIKVIFSFLYRNQFYPTKYVIYNNYKEI